MSPKRIAIAGFQHETNTFTASRAGWAEFEMADSWPPLLIGAGVIDGMRGLNLPTAGAIAEAEANANVDLVPILWCAAEPSGFVTDDAFDRISRMILAALDEADPLDAIYLDLHGAMVTENNADGEGALLSLIRDQVGDDLPIGVSLDLHANISAALVDMATTIAVFRTYPHLDMAETGARCMRNLLRRIDGSPSSSALLQAPFLVPLQAQYTGADPCKALYRLAEDLSGDTGEHVELAMGFTASDIPDCGPSVVGYAATRERATTLAQKVLQQLNEREASFEATLIDVDDAVRMALEMAGDGPIVLADVQDNPGAGGTSDTVGLLRVLVANAAPDAALGVFHDPDTARRAHQAGPGAIFEAALGGRSGIAGETPFKARFRVEALSDGRINYTGQMYGGGQAEVGPSCLLSLADVPGRIRVVVSSVRTQCLDLAFFTHFGLDPTQIAIVGVKSTVHFRAEFEPISRSILNTAAPGAFPCRLNEITYRNLRSQVRVALSKGSAELGSPAASLT